MSEEEEEERMSSSDRRTREGSQQQQQGPTRPTMARDDDDDPSDGRRFITNVVERGSIPLQPIEEDLSAAAAAAAEDEEEEEEEEKEEESNVPSATLLLVPQAAAGTGVGGCGGPGRPKASGSGGGVEGIRAPPPPPSTASERQQGGYRVVKIEEKHGALHRAIPLMPLWLAILLCILNILLPGTGTIVSSFAVLCCGMTSRVTNRVHSVVLNLVSGFLQMATFLLIVGWIWSILWGMTFVQLALSAKEPSCPGAGGTAGRGSSSLPSSSFYARRHSSIE